jgi:hypothetical protein
MNVLKAVRKKCLDCSGTYKAVKWCPCDGLHGSPCALWPLRFGIRPETARRRYGERFLDPAAMPSGNVPLEDVDADAPASPTARKEGTTGGGFGRSARTKGNQSPKGAR